MKNLTEKQQELWNFQQHLAQVLTRQTRSNYRNREGPAPPRKLLLPSEDQDFIP